MPSVRVVRPLRLEVHKTSFWPARGPNELHTIIYDCGAGERFHTLVHVPPELLGDLCSGSVRRFLLIQLKLNGDAMRALPDCPQYLIAGLALNDGVIATALPPEFRKVRQNLLDKARRVAAVATAGTLLSPWALSLLLLAVKHWLEACAVPSLRWLDAIKEEDVPSRHPRHEVPRRGHWHAYNEFVFICERCDFQTSAWLKGQREARPPLMTRLFGHVEQPRYPDPPH